MTEQSEKATAPILPVAADREQSPPYVGEPSIPQSPAEHKEKLQEMVRRLRAMERENDPNRLRTFTMKDLYDTVYPGRLPLVDGLLYPGTYIFAGAPKVGKSFFMEQLAYHVSTGLPLWELPVRQGTVLYLALEDTKERLQKRMFRMFGAEETPNLCFATAAGEVNGNLADQLWNFLREHPDTRLIIVDTLQRVRGSDDGKYSYTNDYAVITQLMQMLPDPNAVCLLLVHHTRKQDAEDKHDMISGTHGLTGAVDGSFVLYKESRTSNRAVLEASGRDQQDLKLYLVRDQEHLSWNLERMETELWKEPPDPVLEAVAAVVNGEQPQWVGSPTELAKVIQTDLKPNALSAKLNVSASRLLREYGVRYRNKRTHDGRQITLMFDSGVTMCDGRDGVSPGGENIVTIDTDRHAVG